MAHRAFVPYPAKVLRTPAAPVEAITDEVRVIWEEMLEAMYGMPGVGLAAPQLGIGLRLAVVDAGEDRQAIRMANPEVLHASVKMNEHPEASPNMPGVHARITRPRAVTVAFVDAQGVQKEQDFVGLWATSVQHQIDHLNGKMYFDHLSKLKRDMLIRKARK